MPEGFPHATIPTPDQAVAWLSQHRYDKYLTLASGDHMLAMQIYAWNSELSSAILRDLAHVEVSVRNALDAQLAPAFPDWAAQPAPGWLHLENGTQRVRLRQQRLNSDGRKLLRSAQRDIGAAATHGMVIARLSFGFWQFLITPRARESTLWTPYLHRLFRAEQPVPTSRSFWSPPSAYETGWLTSNPSPATQPASRADWQT
ncbi:hypothetical protein [Specibacter cremeus]|uniref:hypothetical protein n=1 Tax=Specibacter cremeus TaxID=1629051 RepID=UPI000F7968BE|nr:hypothetical protein [Specibacter cremeus]